MTKDEIKDQDENNGRKLFVDEEIERHLGPSGELEDFHDFDGHDNTELTNPDMCKDEEQEESFAPDLDDLPDDACDNRAGQN